MTINDSVRACPSNNLRVSANDRQKHTVCYRPAGWEHEQALRSSLLLEHEKVLCSPLRPPANHTTFLGRMRQRLVDETIEKPSGIGGVQRLTRAKNIVQVSKGLHFGTTGCSSPTQAAAHSSLPQRWSGMSQQANALPASTALSRPQRSPLCVACMLTLPYSTSPTGCTPILTSHPSALSRGALCSESEPPKLPDHIISSPEKVRLQGCYNRPLRQPCLAKCQAGIKYTAKPLHSKAAIEFSAITPPHSASRRCPLTGLVGIQKNLKVAPKQATHLRAQ